MIITILIVILYLLYPSSSEKPLTQNQVNISNNTKTTILNTKHKQLFSLEINSENNLANKDLTEEMNRLAEASMHNDLTEQMERLVESNETPNINELTEEMDRLAESSNEYDEITDNMNQPKSDINASDDLTNEMNLMIQDAKLQEMYHHNSEE